MKLRVYINTLNKRWILQVIEKSVPSILFVSHSSVNKGLKYTKYNNFYKVVTEIVPSKYDPLSQIQAVYVECEEMEKNKDEFCGQVEKSMRFSETGDYFPFTGFWEPEMEKFEQYLGRMNEEAIISFINVSIRSL